MRMMNSEQVATVKYIIDGPACFIVGAVGIVINMAAIVVMARKRVNKTFHLLMINLSCWDFCYLVMSLLCFSLPALSSDYRQKVFVHLLSIAVPIAQICLSGSCYSTIALTVERYIMMCKPFYHLKHQLNARNFIIPILVFAPIYSIPRFFEVGSYYNTTYICLKNETQWFPDVTQPEPLHMTDPNGTLFQNASKKDFEGSFENMEISEVDFSSLTTEDKDLHCKHWRTRSQLVVYLTQLRKNRIYVLVYVNCVNMFINLLVPTVVLGVLNLQIYKSLSPGLDRANELRRSLGISHELQKRDIRLTRISLFIIFVFIVCHLPRFIPNLTEIVTNDPPGWVNILISFNNLLQVTNSTVNCAIYFCHCYRTNGPAVLNDNDTRSHTFRNSTIATPQILLPVSIALSTLSSSVTGSTRATAMAAAAAAATTSSTTPNERLSSPASGSSSSSTLTTTTTV